jgi:hypothetical protein
MKTAVELFLNWILKRFDDYNQDFKKHRGL